MIDYTLENVKKQLQGMSCQQYKIGVYSRVDRKMVIRHNLSIDGVLRLVPWLKHENANGQDIFVTQAKDIDRALILVDDLEVGQIESMRARKVSPACVIETSPGNYQAWVSLGMEPMPKGQRKIVAAKFAQEFGGDPACADANHFGRLAGFTNRKPIRLTAKGHPFVICLFAESRLQAENSEEIRKWAKTMAELAEQEIKEKETSQLVIDAPKTISGKPQKDPSAAYSEYFGQWWRYVGLAGKSEDLSRGDFAVACRMLKEGYSESDIVSALIEKSPNITVRKLNHVEDYARRTVLAAANKIINT
jgi:hypothetical protein